MTKELPKKGMDGKVKTTHEVSLIEAHLVGVRMASSILVIRDPDSPLIFPFQSTTNISSFVMS